MGRHPKWCRMGADYRSSPEAQGVNFWAATLYLDLRLINRRESCRGSIPARFVAPKVLATLTGLAAVGETLAIPAIDLIRSALTDLEGARIIRLTPDHLELVGYHPIWDTAPDLSTERSRQLRERRDESPKVTAKAPEVPPEPKQRPPRKTKAQQLIKAHGEDAGALWDRQEILRAAAIPRARPLIMNEARQVRVCERLADGNSSDDCLAVLEEYAAEARRNPASARHFNGETNWRRDNFDRQLGMTRDGDPADAIRVELVAFLEWFNARNRREFKPRDELIDWLGVLIAKGYTQQDLRMVAEDRRIEWTDDQAKHLRPQVLLKPANFERWVDGARERWGKEHPEPQTEPAIRLFEDR